MGQPIDITGQKCNHLTVIRDATYEERPNKKKTYCWCQCDCGNPNLLLKEKREIREKKAIGCPDCVKRHMSEIKTIDLTGKKFGQLTVKKKVGKDKWRNTVWECYCDCGNSNPVNVPEGDLVKNKKINCGCKKIKSKMEIRIAEILSENNILFEEQKTFDTCRFENNYLAYFDFWVDNKYIIEYDGEYHYIPSSQVSSDEVQATQQRDKIKTQWCKDNNIPLIRIPFTQKKFITIEDLKLETSLFLVE